MSEPSSLWSSAHPSDRAMQDMPIVSLVGEQASKVIARAAAVQPQSSLAAAAAQAIQGELDARALIAAIDDGMAPADALHDGLEGIRAVGNPCRFKAALRLLQKRLERGT